MIYEHGQCEQPKQNVLFCKFMLVRVCFFLTQIGR